MKIRVRVFKEPGEVYSVKYKKGWFWCQLSVYDYDTHDPRGEKIPRLFETPEAAIEAVKKELKEVTKPKPKLVIETTI